MAVLVLVLTAETIPDVWVLVFALMTAARDVVAVRSAESVCELTPEAIPATAVSVCELTPEVIPDV